MSANETAARQAAIRIALIDSLVKEINCRGNVTEKFRNDPGSANPIPALNVTSHCDDDR